MRFGLSWEEDINHIVKGNTSIIRVSIPKTQFQNLKSKFYSSYLFHPTNIINIAFDVHIPKSAKINKTLEIFDPFYPYNIIVFGVIFPKLQIPKLTLLGQWPQLSVKKKHPLMLRLFMLRSLLPRVVFLIRSILGQDSAFFPDPIFLFNLNLEFFSIFLASSS